MDTARSGEDDGLSVTALGTGASALDNGRASVGYVVHVDEEPRLLVDAGGGTAGRLSDARIDLTALDAVLLGHLHIDHTADLPAIVKAAYQQGRGDRPLEVYGPAGNAAQPGTEAWISTLFDAESGAYGYLSDFVERYADGELSLPTTEIDAVAGRDDAVTRVYDRDGVTVDAIPVVHGRVPTLAYRVAANGASITFSGDYAAETDNVARLADGSDVLVQHRLLEAGADGPKTELHPLPEEVGRIARDAGVGTLAVSHVGRDDREALESALETVREAFDGRIVVLDDLVDIAPDGTVLETQEIRETGSGSGASRRRSEAFVFASERSDS
ncbi:MBL fold metallo-hydrolase [Haloterrigena sp. SYSU A558-1]|uniref:MBL fold metallo-hydrolase n=1 Tax=Haloterrigena gelatinilytica TaxID=2741724 RepID=A0ABX2LHF0_9EURY|nr:MBL fold metallo-hydrolase [Haloterrigena gelatinilytica]NUC72181.1 MBL fold metallo-hydrolase [Haloterrigena gelatinilytica]